MRPIWQDYVPYHILKHNSMFNEIAMTEANYMSNITPQTPSFNRGIWKSLETCVRNWVEIYDTVFVVTGPVYSSDMTKIGNDIHVSVPKSFFKAILVYNDSLKTAIAFHIPNQKISGQDICCQVTHGGELRSYKGLNTPGTRINLPAIGDEDRIDIVTALENEVDFLAASFTRSTEDVLEIRRLVEKHGGNIMILAKIESREGVENFDSILEVSDGIMVARGDLGVEIPPEEVPLLQKEFIKKCNMIGKPVITATQMLDR